MSPPQAVASVLSNYANFSGRAPRSEFWWWSLFNMAMLIGLIAAGIPFKDGSIPDKGFAVIFFLYILATFLPNLAVAIRRFHDSDKSGWWFLLAFIPVGGIVLLVFYCLPGTPGTNRFGGPTTPTGGPLDLPSANT